MPIPFNCPHCGKHTEVAQQYAGRSGPCAGCGQTVTIPSLESDLAPFPPRRSDKSLTTVLIVIAVLFGLLVCGGVLAAMLLPAVNNVRQLARDTACVSNMRMIGTALMTYESRYDSLPPAYVTDAKGRPLYSWRVLILPFLGEESLYRQFRLDEPWDSPHNRALAEQMPRVFRCPSRSSTDRTLTNYMAVVGPHTAFPGSQGVRLGEIRDGLAKTLLVLETEGSGVCWSSPVDVSLDRLSRTGGTEERPRSSVHRPGLHALFADGSARRLPPTVNAQTLRQAAICDDNQPQDVRTLLGD